MDESAFQTSYAYEYDYGKNRWEILSVQLSLFNIHNSQNLTDHGHRQEQKKESPGSYINHFTPITALSLSIEMILLLKIILLLLVSPVSVEKLKIASSASRSKAAPNKGPGKLLRFTSKPGNTCTLRYLYDYKALVWYIGVYSMGVTCRKSNKRRYVNSKDA